MNAQTQTASILTCNFVVAPEEPIFADSRDYGFDFDEEELARELLAPLPLFYQASLAADDSEFAAHFFLA